MPALPAKTKHLARQAVWRVIYPTVQCWRPRPPVEFVPLANQREYAEYQRAQEREIARRRSVEAELYRERPAFRSRGFCYTCQRWTRFYTTLQAARIAENGALIPYWREHLLCPICGLSGRVRAAVHLLDTRVKLPPDADLLLPEQTTRFYAYMARRFPRLIASEFLGNAVPLGQCDPRGIRNESLTQLSFPENRFQAIIALEIFEHVPDYPAAFRECARCLQNGGTLLFSVPFYPAQSQTLIRAAFGPEGRLIHHVPPEYHGDPLNPEGCLCFQYFGWDIFTELRAAGFADVTACTYWSEPYGYLGEQQFVFLCRK